MKKLLRVISYIVLIGIALWFWIDSFRWQEHAENLTKAVESCAKYDDYSRCMSNLEIWETDNGQYVLLLEEARVCEKYLHTLQE